jgi:hypothetical protein
LNVLSISRSKMPLINLALNLMPAPDITAYAPLHMFKGFPQPVEKG